MKLNRHIFFFFIIGCFILPLFSYGQNNQDQLLAAEYFKKGEFEKAAPIYKKLSESFESNTNFYRQYFQCLLELGQYQTAEELLKKQKKKNKKTDPSIFVDQGNLYHAQGQEVEAQKQYEQAINALDEDPNQTRTVANLFSSMGEDDLLIKTYEKGRTLDKTPFAYSYDLAQAYKKKGKYSLVVTNLLDFLESNPNNSQIVKNEFQNILNFEDHSDDLVSQLYKRVQKEELTTTFTELLTWVFIQQKDYESAFIQSKALDKRFGEDGHRVFNLGTVAKNEGQYDAAIQCFEYIIAKGDMSILYQQAQVEIIETKTDKITNTNSYTTEDINSLVLDYDKLFESLGKTPNTANSMRRQAEIYAYYAFDLPKAIAIDEEILMMPGVSAQTKGWAKIDLGNYYILSGDVWEATLYYSQVDKDFKEDILGEEARFNNAKLSYYLGDFEWAQTQLGVLKASTSELISNDALELGVFIMDNLGLDTTEVTMQMFARADLLIFQNKTKDALKVLDSLDNMYPGHSLTDDIIYRRGQLAEKERIFDIAAKYYEQVYTLFPDDILADNALFRFAEITNYQLKDTPKAMQLYQDLLINYPSSLFTVEARKCYRLLRGDIVN